MTIFQLTGCSFSANIEFVRTSLIIFSLSILFFVPQVFAGGNGPALYVNNCSVCHGKGGEGGKGPMLRKEGLLRTVGTGYFINSMRYGRPILGCPSFEGKLNDQEMSEVASYIKSWQEDEDLKAPSGDVKPVMTQRGEKHFTLCGGCHGLEGEGAMGPPLLDPGLLASISDTELRRTIMWGRPGTPMKGYLKDMGGLAVLSPEEIDEIISYMRFRQMMRP